MISNELDFAPFRATLATRGRVQITDFLQPDAAERLRRCLLEDVPWSLAERGQPDCLHSELASNGERIAAAYQRAREDFHFVYDRFLMLEAMQKGAHPELILHTVFEFLNSPQFLEFARWLTGDRELSMVGAQATRYTPGQFLRLHDDRHDEERRRYAYVINLSRDWQPDWGGLLHFVDARQRVTDSFVPLWNSLSLLKVPANHFVGLVAPWAAEPRLAITGWWHAGPA